MKNIKTFEGFFDFFKRKEKKVLQDKLYDEISAQEFAQILDTHENEEVTDSEQKILKKYYKYTNIDIYKLTDEWFLVMIYIKGLLMYFRCDTFDGLIQFLDEKSDLLKKNILGN